MFVGEAPGFHEDQQGVPFVGQAGMLLDKLLAGIELTRADVFVANVLKCRPLGNRDPPGGDRRMRAAPLPPDRADPAEARGDLGNFATKLLSGKPAGITKVHGYEQEVTLGARSALLYSALPPGGGALHAVDAEGARGGLRAHSGAAGAHGRRGARAPVSRPSSNPEPRPRVDPARPVLDVHIELASASAGETERIAAALAERPAVGDVVTVSGELGSREDHLRTGSLPRARCNRAGDEPDVHDRASP